METATLSYREGLYNAMHDALAAHDHTLIIGQGVTDHKGIFGTTTGLAEKFGEERVLDTPLAEESITGVCIGAALNGLYPINTHIRADFSLFDVPMLIRLVVGRSWGQGAQHSQSLQSLFAHIPGLMVIMPSSPHAIEASYGHAIAHHRGPVISLEHRLMYELQFNGDGWSSVAGETPFSSRLVRNGGDVTVVATSIMVLEAMRAAEHLSGHGIDCEVIDLHCISHPDKQMIIDSVARTGRLLVADTSWTAYGVAAEVGRIMVEHDPSLLRAPMVSMGMQPSPCPTAKSLEDIFYPTVGELCENIARLVKGHEAEAIPMPSEKSMSDFYKAFRGPF